MTKDLSDSWGEGVLNGIIGLYPTSHTARYVDTKSAITKNSTGNQPSIAVASGSGTTVSQQVGPGINRPPNRSRGVSARPLQPAVADCGPYLGKGE